ncbi:MAG: hypothetical protein JO022_18510 [Acidobacteriaceae bacterium]|nr:hypothetical protein [Acidobacteriaceae bacterium]
MNKFTICLLAVFGVAAAHADDLPKGETVLDRFVEVTGGKAAYEKLHNEVTKGHIEFVGKGIKGTIVSYHAEPNKDYTIAELEGVGKIESGNDGEVLWEKSAITGARVKAGEEREEAMRVGTFNPHINWRKMYVTAETVGLENAEGVECYKVVLTPPDGATVTQYFSKKSGFLVKSSSIHKTQMGDIPADSVTKDYKESSGVLVPFTLVNRFAGQEIQVVLDSVEFNADMKDSTFNLPDEIKALVRKNGAANESKNKNQ